MRRALDDLPAEARDDLVDDLPAHLAEVRREQAGPLEERLGPPEVYAAELRAAAGLHPGADPAAGTVRDRLATVGLLAARLLRRADRKAGPWIGYGKVSDFLRLLRPAWWVARGYIVAAMLFLSRILPMEQFDEVFGWLVVLVCVVVSVRLGPILQRLPRVGRFVAATALALGALVVAANVHIGATAAVSPPG